ncbi:hypothetical protein [Nocardioides panaciterrulae]|uniref:Uncharacterized protein n=1 Tax=Nocardioides panaciterrulae TaxID=661492 RepID=A0A7Y9E344_9ACTN|nr:hypothetical protein [Nocardioides panaciterrulae]NYD40067.1 hypothetical protein [Nocardioides panaciterrulae]
MSEPELPRRRLRFYGLSDYATFFQLEQVVGLLGALDSSQQPSEVNDVVEIHHAGRFADQDLFPASVTEEERRALRARIADVRRIVGTFFSQVDDANFATRITEVDFQYHTDVLDLLARNGVFHRCSASVVLPALKQARFHTGELLSNAALVRAYDAEVRALLLASPKHAEQIIAKHLQADGGRDIHLPQSLTADDSRGLIETYIDSDGPNPNYLKLVADARTDRNTGIDPKLKLKAQRAYDAYWKKHFETNEGIKTGCEIRVADDQDDPVATSLDGLVGKYSYSREWLNASLDNPSILNNFIYLFEFSSHHMLLNFPSFSAQLGVVERFLVTTGKDSYRTGAAFDHSNQASFLQLVMYEQFLRSESIELENVLAWFFEDYLPAEFGVDNLRFRPASSTASFLEKARHLFAEMESVLKQYSLYVENGQLDPELLAMTSEQLSYRAIPSFVEGKYVYVTDNPEVRRIQHLLFSDQAVLGYIDGSLQEDTFARLILKHDVPYEAFAEHQRADIDFLVEGGIVENENGKPLRFANLAQFEVLLSLNNFEAASFNRHSQASQDAIEEMEQKGWVTRRSSLLTAPESSYFNYMLNQSEFSNGPDLRNRYLHGSQADGEDDREHFHTYIHALRLLVALVIKINDDLELRESN